MKRFSARQIKKIFFRGKYYFGKFRVKYADIFGNHDIGKQLKHGGIAAAIEVAEKRCQRILSFTDKGKIMAIMEQYNPSAISRTISEADKICCHRFNIFGKEYYLGENINWHRDSKTGYVWEQKYYADIKSIDLTNNADIKYAWEINRFHHTVILGKAYWYTGDEKYTEEFVQQVLSWNESNPYSRGINWNCSMEVAIRAVNIIWAYMFFMESPKVTGSFREKICKLMFLHGKHIRENLENRGRVNNNHYIADLIGLIYISKLFPVFHSSGKYESFAIREIRKEMDRQVNNDGACYEDSIPYHRFVTEMLFHAFFLQKRLDEWSDQTTDADCKRNRDNKIGADYLEVLEKMFEFTLFYTKPDGSAPQIGDNDGGRLLPLGDPDEYNGNHLHMSAIAGEFFNRDDFRQAGFDNYEEAIWLFGKRIELPLRKKLSVNSMAFADSGYYVMRGNDDFLIVKCAKLGTGGKGTHTHNDNLSFELCMNGITYITDPGTYTYSSDKDMRNLFRSTQYHNTLVIDDMEQNTISERDLFLLQGNSVPKVNSWTSDLRRDVFDGEVKFNVGTGREIIHKRKIIFNKAEEIWQICDELLGDGDHELVWHFHLASGIKVECGRNSIHLRHDKSYAALMKFAAPEGCNIEICKGWHSPAYGIKTEKNIIKIVITRRLPTEQSFSFTKSRA